ncbi:MAG: hypothetical protein V1652_02535 [bacterium]
MKKNIAIGILLITAIFGWTSSKATHIQLEETKQTAFSVISEKNEKIHTLSEQYSALDEKYIVTEEALEKISAEKGSIEMQFEYLDGKYGELDAVLTEIADQEYILDEHDCKHFSAELKDKLENIGIESEIVLGEDGEEKGHAWVGLWIEPQTGDFVFVADNYDENYLPTDSTVEVIDVYFTADEVYSMPHIPNQ